MVGKYKDFFNFINIIGPNLVKLWEDLNLRPDPKKGDMFDILYPFTYEETVYNVSHTGTPIKAKFIKVEYDPEFKNGVAFYYIFENVYTGNEIRLHSINDVYDVTKLTIEEKNDLFGFWTHCTPYIENFKN